jgi:hypothetical protein
VQQGLELGLTYRVQQFDASGVHLSTLSAIPHSPHEDVIGQIKLEYVADRERNPGVESKPALRDIDNAAVAPLISSDNSNAQGSVYIDAWELSAVHVKLIV